LFAIEVVARRDVESDLDRLRVERPRRELEGLFGLEKIVFRGECRAPRHVADEGDEKKQKDVRPASPLTEEAALEESRERCDRSLHENLVGGDSRK